MKEYLVTPAVIGIISVLLILLPLSTLAYAFQGEAAINGEWWRFLTFPFVHVNRQHLFQNMIALAASAALAYELALSSSAYALVFAGANFVLALLATVFFPFTYLAGTSFGIYAVLGRLGMQKNPYLSRTTLFAILLATTLVGLLFTKNSALHLLGFGTGSALFFLTIKRQTKVFLMQGA